MDTDEYEGGINIEQARKRMMEEDKFDKELYRDKIRQKHKVNYILSFHEGLHGNLCWDIMWQGIRKYVLEYHKLCHGMIPM